MSKSMVIIDTDKGWGHDYREWPQLQPQIHGFTGIQAPQGISEAWFELKIKNKSFAIRIKIGIELKLNTDN